MLFFPFSNNFFLRVDNSDVANNCKLLRLDKELQKADYFLDFLICQLQEDRRKRLPAKKLLQHNFILPFTAITLIQSIKKVRNVKVRTICNTIQEKCEAKHPISSKKIRNLLTQLMIILAGIRDTNNVKLLCKLGTDPNGQNINGTTALHSASSNGSYSTLEYLAKEAKAGVNITDAHSDTALHKAALVGHPDIVKLLCESGAEINKRGSFGYTPLHYASAFGHVFTVDLLLKMRADKTIKDIVGRTARDVAGIFCIDGEHKQQIKSFWKNVK